MDWRKKYEKIISSPDYVGCIFLLAGESGSCWESGPVNPGPDAAASPLSLVFSEKLKNFQGS